MGQKTKTRKSENAIFPLIFWWLQRQELISGPGGGAFFWYSSVADEFFLTPFLGGPISKAECTQTILYYKNRGFGTFRGSKKWAKI